MVSKTVTDPWSSGDSYERYIGRWSRLVADKFIEWLGQDAGLRWLDIGCGTGALTATVLVRTAPFAVVGVDPSTAHIAYAREHSTDERAQFEVGEAGSLAVGDGTFDVAVSGLVLNFVSDRPGALGEMLRAVLPGGVVAAYVWDYPGEMQLIGHFWDAAVELDPAARERHEAVRFPFCRPEPLRELFTRAGLVEVSATALTVPTVFPDFADFWSPFLGGQGPAPGYVMSLGEAERVALRRAVEARLPRQPDGSIHLTARAWAVRGTRP